LINRYRPLVLKDLMMLFLRNISVRLNVTELVTTQVSVWVDFAVKTNELKISIGLGT
jgi:hypothetical protein